jgi:ABC-2 type transport system permease protein
MNKILLIIQREYLSRVKKKSFIWMTLLVPMLFIGMNGLVVYLVTNGDELGDIKTVQVVDENGMFKGKLKSTSTVKFSYSDKSYADERKTFLDSDKDYLLHITPTLKDVQILSEKKPSATLVANIEGQVNEQIKNKKLMDAGIDLKVLEDSEKGIDIESKQITDEGEKDAGTIMAYAVGFLTAILIYMSLFIYGAQVMRGVIEEKTSRVIEVIISSVKPFQLMLGKIVGVGMVGLTQFFLWIIISVALSATLLPSMLGDKLKMVAQTEQVSAQGSQTVATETTTGTTVVIAKDSTAAPKEEEKDIKKEMMEQFANFPLGYTIFCFLFYFLTGYLLYSAIFAAVGSAVDNETETQQFMLPITLPLVFTFILSMNFIINNPDSQLSFWLSMIPFTSPIAMMIRIPFGVPVWQLALSMGLMIGGFLFTTWVAARIYRVGVLMYGKKASYKELAKWFFYKE